MSKSTVQKGKILENHVADRIRELGIDPKATRSHGSGNGNREKSDIWTNMMILGQNAGIECKNQKTLKIPEWWRQVQELESLGREPVLVFKFHGEQVQEAKATVYLETLLLLIRAANKASIPAETVPDGIAGVVKDLRALADELEGVVMNSLSP